MTIDVMFHNGATSRSYGATSVDPRRALTEENLAAPFEGTGLNGPFVADLLSAMLTHERCGTHLYRSVAARSLNPMLQRRYQELGDETAHHVEVLEELVAGCGGDPMYVSPTARAVQRMDTSALESTFLLAGSLDPMVQEMAMLDAVILAEVIDHANWSNLARLADATPEGPIRDAMTAAVEAVEPEEDAHLTWALETKAKMTELQATSPTMAKVGMTVESVTAVVRDMFSSMPGT